MVGDKCHTAHIPHHFTHYAAQLQEELQQQAAATVVPPNAELTRPE